MLKLFVNMLVICICVAVNLTYNPFDQATINCGLEPDINRVLTYAKMKTAIVNRLDLVRLAKNEDNLVIWAVSMKQGEEARYHQSTDRGITWHADNGNMGKYTNIPVTSDNPPYRLTGSMYNSALYEFEGCEQRVIMDGGKTEKDITAQKTNGDLLFDCRPLYVRNNGKQLYIRASDKSNEGLWVSENYGTSYRFITKEGGFVFECQASSERMYGKTDKFLMRSDNEGKEWIILDASTFMFREIFYGKDNIYRTWNYGNQGTDMGYPGRVIQAQTDPRNKDIIYILTIKGIYRSNDAGTSFVLLPFQSDMILNISRIACDPLDGRYLYAVVGWDSIYRSDDFGCNWQKLDTNF